MKIKKALLFKIIAVCVSLCLFVHGLGYAAPCLRVNSIFDPINKSQDLKRPTELLNSIPAYEYSPSDFFKRIKVADFFEGIKSDTPGQRFGRSIALVLLFLATLFILVLALSIKKPVFFVQERFGYQGKSILVPKLRTYTNEPDIQSRNKTPLGIFMRDKCLDEFPQLLSIVLGDMQWFGPRPYVKERIPKELLQRHVNDVLSKTKPGLFSWAVLRRGIGKEGMMTLEQVEADLQEIEQRSILGNTHLLLASVAVMAGLPLTKLHKIDPFVALEYRWGSFEELIKEVVERSRMDLIVRLGEHHDNPLSADALCPANQIDPCTEAQSDVKEIIRHLTENSKEVEIRPYQARDLFKGHSHMFMVASCKGRDYLIDTTFMQYFNRSKETLMGEYGKVFLPWYIIENSNKPEWNTFTYQLLKNGYIELTDEVANMYGILLGGKIDPEKTFTKNNFLSSETTKHEHNPGHLNKLFGNLKHRAMRTFSRKEKDKINSFLEEALKELTKTVNRRIGAVSPKTILRQTQLGVTRGYKKDFHINFATRMADAVHAYKEAFKDSLGPGFDIDIFCRKKSGEGSKKWRDLSSVYKSLRLELKHLALVQIKIVNKQGNLPDDILLYVIDNFQKAMEIEDYIGESYEENIFEFSLGILKEKLLDFKKRGYRVPYTPIVKPGPDVTDLGDSVFEIFKEMLLSTFHRTRNAL